jgi:hypothetical protein
VPGPRRSEDAPVVSGEANKPKSADDRAVDAPARIVVTPMPRAQTSNPAPTASRTPPVPVHSARPSAPIERTGAWVVVLVYVVSVAALAYAIWERFLR